MNGLLSNWCHSVFCLFMLIAIDSVAFLFGVFEECWRLILACATKLDSAALRFWPANGSWLGSAYFTLCELEANLTLIDSSGFSGVKFYLAILGLNFDCLEETSYWAFSFDLYGFTHFAAEATWRGYSGSKAAWWRPCDWSSKDASF